MFSPATSFPVMDQPPPRVMCGKLMGDLWGWGGVGGVGQESFLKHEAKRERGSEGPAISNTRQGSEKEAPRARLSKKGPEICFLMVAEWSWFQRIC